MNIFSKDLRFVAHLVLIMAMAFPSAIHFGHKIKNPNYAKLIESARIITSVFAKEVMTVGWIWKRVKTQASLFLQIFTVYLGGVSVLMATANFYCLLRNFV